MKIYDELTRQQFVQRENAIYHPTYDEELAYYDKIKSGDVEALEKKEDWEDIDMPSRGILSKNPIRNLKYHMIVSVTMITRFCIEGGLSEKEAYTLSDIYINRIDEAATKEELSRLQREVAFDFANRMKKQKETKNHSIHCAKALDYIYNHLHEQIRIREVADYVGVSEAYISKLFLKETGCSVCDFIRLQKVNAAKNMLMYSDYSCGEIAHYFAFASNSHFSKIFKEYTNMTPLQFRNENYRIHFGQENRKTFEMV